MKLLARLLLAAALLTTLSACPPRSLLRSGDGAAVDEAARAELEAARAKVSAGDHARAAEMFDTVARRYPDSVEADEALFEAGRAWERANQPIRARASYERLLERHPRSDKAQQAEARVAALGGNQDAAFAREQASFETLPDDRKHAEALRLAADAEARGDGLAAFHWREEALRRSPDAAARERDEGELGRLLGVLPAEQVEELAGELDPASPAAAPVAHAMTLVHQSRRDWDRLEESLRDFVARFPSHPLAAAARELLAKVERRGEVDPRAVGVVLPLSGQHKVYGQHLLAGIELALQGSGLRVVVKDSLGDAEGARAAVESLLYEEHAMAILGGVLTAEAQAAAETADELGVPFVGFSRSEGYTEQSEWVFRDMLTNSAIAEALVGFAMDRRGMRRFAILHPEIAYGNELRDLFWDLVEEKGGNIQAVESYPQETTTFAEPIKKLVGRFYAENRAHYRGSLKLLRTEKAEEVRAQRAQHSRAHKNTPPVVDFQALFLPDQWKTVALVAPALAFEDVITNWCQEWDLRRIAKTTKRPVKPVMLLGGNLWNHPDLPTRAGKYINCSVFVDGWYAGSTRPETAEFVALFEQARGRAPFLLEAYGYEAALVVREVLDEARPADRRAFLDAMLDVRSMPGPMGPIAVTEDRELVHPLYFLTVDDGTIREVDFDAPNGKL